MVVASTMSHRSNLQSHSRRHWHLTQESFHKNRMRDEELMKAASAPPQATIAHGSIARGDDHADASGRLAPRPERAHETLRFPD
jgi:hypothetical protein